MALKTAVISPAIAMQQQQAPQSSDEQRLFEDKFGQMAYTAFSSKYPDLVPDIVTFKILDADLDSGISIGAFIIEKEGEYIYIPAVLSENELKPFDLMYVKSKDIFLPLDSAWIQEVAKNTVSSMGEGTELPETVPTDVDIRNVMIPPMTGRASYASYVGPITEESRFHAAATEPLGRRLVKMAAIGEFPDPNAPAGGGGGGGGGGASGGQGTPGHEGETSFDPNMWAGFIQQFELTQGMTPGQAIDTGAMDLESMSKMFKTHQKAWSTPELPQQQQAAAEAQQQPQQPAVAPAGMPPPSPQQQGMTATASWNKQASRIPGVKTIGEKIDEAVHHAVRSGALGGLTGGVVAASDGDYRDLPSSMVRGAVGGALLGPVGNMLGEEAYAHFPDTVNLDKARKAGRVGGAMFGGLVGGKSEPPPPQMGGPHGNSMFSRASQLVMPPVLNMVTASDRTVTASDYSAGLRAMIKHAQKDSTYAPYLPQFLYEAPNHIKQAFVQVLDKHPRLLKRAVDLYGVKTLQRCLRQTKTAGITQQKADLRVADGNTTADGYRDYFGEGAVNAYQNVLRRGYYYEDTRPGLKTAVQVQEYHDMQNALDAGVYRLFTTKGAPEGALVLVEPLDLLGQDRPTFPHDYESRVKPLRLRVPRSFGDSEPNALEHFSQGMGRGPTPTEQSHRYTRLAILEDGKYIVTTTLYGEQVTEGYLKGTPLHRALQERDRKPKQGKGCFIGRAGSGWVGTLPITIQNVTTGSDGTIRGKMTDSAGWADKSFVIDPNARTTRPMRPQSGAVVIPASWRWVPLAGELDDGELITDPRALQRLVLDKFTTYNAVKLATVHARQGHFLVERESLPWPEALMKIAHVYHVHAADAEAMLKIADAEGLCRAFVVPRDVLRHVRQTVKIAQGMPQPAPAPTPQAPPGPPPPAPPGLPGAPAGAAPAALPAPAAQDPSGAMPPPQSAVDQAFSESLGGLEQQMQQLQAQLDVLQSVQQRAQQIEMQQQGMDPSMMGMDPSMQGQPGMAPPGMDPSMMGQPGMDPSMMAPPGMQQTDPSMQGAPGQMAAPGMDPSMDPSMQGVDEQLPIMRTEAPSAEEIAQQISPDFLEQAGQLQETGAFDAASIASLAQNGNLKTITSQYAANLENTVDDLGRTLLTLYMQEPALKTQLGDETYLELETQLRDTFRGLGKLVLSLTHNSAMLDSDAAP